MNELTLIGVFGPGELEAKGLEGVGLGAEGVSFLFSDGAVGRVLALDVEEVAALGQVYGGRNRALSRLLDDVPLPQPDRGVLVAVERWPTHGGCVRNASGIY